MTLSTTRDVDVFLLGEMANGRLPLQIGTDVLAAYGPAAAVQRFVVKLFTRRGQIVNDEERGTDLLRLLTTGKLRTDADLSMAFNSAAHDALRALAVESSDSGDEDELPVEATLRGAQILPDSVTFSISLRMASGRLASFDLPFSM